MPKLTQSNIKHLDVPVKVGLMPAQLNVGLESFHADAALERVRLLLFLLVRLVLRCLLCGVNRLHVLFQERFTKETLRTNLAGVRKIPGVNTYDVFFEMSLLTKGKVTLWV